MSARALARRWLLRWLLLVAWSLALWGALLLLAAVAEAPTQGLRPVFARLLPSPGASVWAWLNALSVALAVAAGLVAGGLYISGRPGLRRGRDRSP